MHKAAAFLIFFTTLLTLRLSAQPTDPSLRSASREYVEALQLLGLQREAAARQALQTLIDRYPLYAPAYRKLSDLLIAAGEIPAARAYFQQLQKVQPGNPGPYYALARLDLAEGKTDAAVERLKTSIRLDPRYADAYGPFGGLPEALAAGSRLAEGITYFDELIARFPDDPYPYLGKGRVYSRMNRWEDALKMLAACLERDSTVAYAYHANIFIYEVIGRYQKALNDSRRLLALAQRADDPDMVAYALLKIGGLYYLGGNFGKSLSFLTRSHRLSVEIGSTRREGMSLLNLGAVYATLGQFQKALEYFESSLSLLQQGGAQRTHIRVLINMGQIYKDLKNFPESQRYFQQALQNADLPTYRVEQGIILGAMAELYLDQNRLQEARQYFERALAVSREVGDESQQGYILRNLGDIFQQSGDEVQAGRFYRESLKIAEATHDAQISWEAHAALGASLMNQQQNREAIAQFAAAIAIFDSVRQDLDVESLAGSFLNEKYEVYPSIIQLLAKEGRFAEGFDYAEKYKANSLLKILSKGRFLLNELLPDSIRFTLLEIRSQLQEAHAAQSAALSAAQPDEQTFLELDQQITSLELRKAAVLSSVKKNFSSYYQLTSAAPLSAEVLRREVLQPAQALVEFIVGPQRISVFIISRDTLAYQELALSHEALLQLVSGLSSIFDGSTEAAGGELFTILNAELADFSVPPAYALYQQLWRPLQGALGTAREVIVVPDDFLFYLPFEALVTDTSGIENRFDFAHARFLLDDYQISYASSASLLDPALHRPHNPTRELLALGNPDFAADPAPGSGGDLAAPRRDRNLWALPNSEKEVEEIGRLLPGSGTKVYTGAEATETVLKEQAAEFRVIHLATHFLTNDREPLYSRMIFSREPDGRNDGELQTYEVFDLRLNADLVVLSACNTALGRLSRGEGLVGITRALLYAGVPSMMVSLWSVDDIATSTIMTAFYRHLKEGLPRNRALQLAKLEYLRGASDLQKDPFFWAPFVLIGDQGPLPLHGGIDYRLAGMILLFLLLAGAVLLVIRRRNKGSSRRVSAAAVEEKS